MLDRTRKKLENALELYDVILLLRTDDRSDKELAERFLHSQAFRESGKRALLLSANECKELEELYYTYEFSDRIRMIGRDRRQGSLMNCVDQGLLTEQEMFEAILR